MSACTVTYPCRTKCRIASSFRRRACSLMLMKNLHLFVDGLIRHVRARAPTVFAPGLPRVHALGTPTAAGHKAGIAAEQPLHIVPRRAVAQIDAPAYLIRVVHQRSVECETRENHDIPDAHRKDGRLSHRLEILRRDEI